MSIDWTRGHILFNGDRCTVALTSPLEHRGSGFVGAASAAIPFTPHKRPSHGNPIIPSEYRGSGFVGAALAANPFTPQRRLSHDNPNYSVGVSWERL